VLLPGQCIGPYAVTEQIGRGGQAVVWAAHHQQSGQQVAIKVLSTLSDDAKLRFEQEAKAQASISSPNVVRIIDLLRLEDQPAIVMERVRGPTLTRVLREHTLSAAQVDQLVDGICLGVMAAHAVGLVHRDIKPSNVLVDTTDGRWTPKLTDFGIARHVVRTAEMDDLTGTGMVLGTPGFMAPEQCTGLANLDPRADVFAVGCLLYALSTGRRPFRGTSRLMVMVATCEGKYTPIRELTPDLPEHRILAIESALQPDREQRIQHVDTLRELWFNRVPVALKQSIAARFDPPEPRAETTAQPEPLDPEQTLERTGRAAQIFGRKRELTQLSEALRSHPLVTVIGLGGTGKTHLAFAAAEALKADLGLQINLADMAHVSSPEACLSTLASGLGIPLAGRDPEAQLGQALNLRADTLLIIDNAETAAEWLRPLLERWLADGLSARLLLTSRVPMRIEHESTLRLAPLSAGAAVEMFKAGARRIGASSAALDVWNPVIEEIVRRVDRLPLAVELAAARTLQLSPEQILAGLEADLLEASDEASSGRHKGLRAMLEQSFAQLPPWSQLALAQASVFQGGFGLRAAEAVLDLSAWPEAPDTMDIIHSLIDHSLLTSQQTQRHGARLQMLATIQAFAAAQMAQVGAVSGPSETPLTGAQAQLALRTRHAGHFGRFGRRSFGEAMQSEGGQRQLAALLRERENILAAADHTLRSDNTGFAYDCTMAMGRIYTHLGPFAAGASRLAKAAKIIGPTGEDAIRLDMVAASMAWKGGRAARGMAHVERAAAQARRLGDPVLEGVALKEQAFISNMQKNISQAKTLANRALALLQQMDQAALSGRRLHAISTCTQIVGDSRAQRAAFGEVLGRARQEGDELLEGVMLGKLAKLQVQDGQIDAARAGLEQAIRIAKTYRSLEREAMATSNLASLNLAGNRLDAALKGNARALALNQHLGYAYGHYLEHGNRGEILIAMGRLSEAKPHLQTAISSESIGLAVWAFRGLLAWIDGQTEGRGPAMATLATSVEMLRAPAPREAAKLFVKLGRLQLMEGDRSSAEATLREATAWAARLHAALGSDLRAACSQLRAELQLAQEQ
jgi:serine/threonine protein kinase/predicted ATPase/predicted negative regulator of RcsB-dependent stress response